MSGNAAEKISPVIRLSGLTKVYGRQRAVNGIDLTILPGEIFGFLGPNGAGKTTTLMMMLGLAEPTSGSASVLGCDPSANPMEVKRRIGYLPENVGFYTDLTARQNLDYVADLNGLSRAEAARRIEAALEAVGLAGERDKLAGAFSRGMRQRLGIAELLIKEPDLIFLDEPTIGLDPDGITKMLDLIVSLGRDRGLTVVLCSHLLHQVQRICTRMGIMINGTMVALGTLEELADRVGQKPDAINLEEIYLRFSREED